LQKFNAGAFNLILLGFDGYLLILPTLYLFILSIHYPRVQKGRQGYEYNIFMVTRPTLVFTPYTLCFFFQFSKINYRIAGYFGGDIILAYFGDF
jgi:hypothetical protein